MCVAITNLLAHPFSQFRFGRHTIPVFQLSKLLFANKILILNVCRSFVKWNQICKEVFCRKMQYLKFFSSFVDRYSNMNQIPTVTVVKPIFQCLQFISWNPINTIVMINRDYLVVHCIKFANSEFKQMEKRECLWKCNFEIFLKYFWNNLKYSLEIARIEARVKEVVSLSLIHISEPTRPY